MGFGIIRPRWKRHRRFTSLYAASCVLRHCQNLLLRRVCTDRDSVQSVYCAAAAKTGHPLHELSSRGTRTARRIGGDAVDDPESAHRAHRIAHEDIQAGIVLVDLEIAGGILHQHLVLTRSAEWAEADSMKVAADRPHQGAAERIARRVVAVEPEIPVVLLHHHL